MQTPDGTYLAAEFNYSLPRQKKGYDTIGYKHHSLNRNNQLDPRFAANIRPTHEVDKGYHTDRTYESPVSESTHVPGRGNAGYHTVNHDEKGNCWWTMP